MITFVQRCVELLTLHDLLISKGFKNKTLAKAIELYPSAYSVLINNVLRPISELQRRDEASPENIDGIFQKESNISEKRTRQKIGSYIEAFKELSIGSEEEWDKGFESNMVTDFLMKTPTESLKLLEGIYYCYYLSTSGYLVKKEPFLIFLDKKNGFYKVRKGNDLGSAKYQGIAYVSNGELLTVHLKEMDTFTQDHFIIHFHLPLTYSFSINLLQGVSISLANNKMPIARKLLLERVDKKPDRKKYDDLETTFFKGRESPKSDIVNYLLSVPNVIDYMNIPYPAYDTSDLIKETKVRELNKQ
ncbi:MAG: hypothetical protein AAFU57_13865 [Bacteroidota bacterium]